MIPANYTPSEEFKVTGTLRPDSIEELLKQAESFTADDADTARCKIEEARGQFPEEDAFQEIKDELSHVLKSVRGANKEAVQRILELVDTLDSEIRGATEYGLSELEDALSSVCKAL